MVFITFDETKILKMKIKIENSIYHVVHLHELIICYIFSMNEVITLIVLVGNEASLHIFAIS